MESSRSRSFFQDIRSREVNGFRVRKRPYPDNELSKFGQIGGAVSMEHSGIYTPPMALSFCKTSKKSHIVAVSDEDGYISLYNTRFKFTSSSTYQENAGMINSMNLFQNFDSILPFYDFQADDTNILTASGDQSIKLWDALEKKCIATLMGHTGTVKSVCCHPTNSDLIVSGSRDGSFALWDLRCANQKGEAVCNVREAHISPHGKRFRRGKSASVSITSVLYLKDEVSIATAGAVHSVVKFWDVRNLKGPVIWACPDPESSTVKSAISPDAAHILGGSSDGNAYIWQVNKPRADPTILKGHDGEVTAVDWCQSEVGKIATSSDDFTVRKAIVVEWCAFGISRNSGYSNSRSPSSIRRRVMAPPTMGMQKAFTGCRTCWT
ncbi:transducin/WD40 repeat-like superfamily protein [Actinidia rufa]|uniref:Transducin/WD40 repeat-like superfamily protein n=1 Tax=Actinidia rufa TaxID=165716 RepID=A0A7J0EL75_9ERIC|nr:transducin/WD40 repeat-like superfamily protein [Actinidia rufa]